MESINILETSFREVELKILKEGWHTWVKVKIEIDEVWLPCRILKHAKNGKSIRVEGPNFGRGHWLPAECTALYIYKAI